jgi:hypothetical protein
MFGDHVLQCCAHDPAIPLVQWWCAVGYTTLSICRAALSKASTVLHTPPQKETQPGHLEALYIPGDAVRGVSPERF